MRKAGFAAALLVLFMACSSEGDDFLTASRNAVADDGRFTTSVRAAQTYADVAASLLESTKRCTADHEAADARCAARASAAAFFRVLSDEVVGCDGAGRRRARLAAGRALDTIEEADRAHGEEPATPPPALPRC